MGKFGLNLIRCQKFLTPKFCVLEVCTVFFLHYMKEDRHRSMRELCRLDLGEPTAGATSCANRKERSFLVWIPVDQWTCLTSRATTAEDLIHLSDRPRTSELYRTACRDRAIDSALFLFPHLHRRIGIFHIGPLPTHTFPMIIYHAVHCFSNSRQFLPHRCDFKRFLAEFCMARSRQGP